MLLKIMLKVDIEKSHGLYKIDFIPWLGLTWGTPIVFNGKFEEYSPRGDSKINMSGIIIIIII